MERLPVSARKAQAKTGRGSSRKPGAPPAGWEVGGSSLEARASSFERFGRLLVLAHDAQHGLAVQLEAGEGADAGGDAARRRVGVTRHEGGDGGGVGSSPVRGVRGGA